MTQCNSWSKEYHFRCRQYFEEEKNQTHMYLFWSRLIIFTGLQCFRLEAAFRNRNPKPILRYVFMDKCLNAWTSKAVAHSNWRQKRRGNDSRMPFSLIYFFAPIFIFYIPHNYVIPQAMPYAIPQTHSSFYPHRYFFFRSRAKEAKKPK